MLSVNHGMLPRDVWCSNVRVMHSQVLSYFEFCLSPLFYERNILCRDCYREAVPLNGRAARKLCVASVAVLRWVHHNLTPCSCYVRQLQPSWRLRGRWLSCMGSCTAASPRSASSQRSSRGPGIRALLLARWRLLQADASAGQGVLAVESMAAFVTNWPSQCT